MGRGRQRTRAERRRRLLGRAGRRLERTRARIGPRPEAATSVPLTQPERGRARRVWEWKVRPSFPTSGCRRPCGRAGSLLVPVPRGGGEGIGPGAPPDPRHQTPVFSSANLDHPRGSPLVPQPLRRAGSKGSGWVKSPTF